MKTDSSTRSSTSELVDGGKLTPDSSSPGACEHETPWLCDTEPAVRRTPLQPFRSELGQGMKADVVAHVTHTLGGDPSTQ